MIFQNKNNIARLLKFNSKKQGGDGLSDRSFIMDPSSYFSLQPVLHN